MMCQTIDWVGGWKRCDVKSKSKYHRKWWKILCDDCFYAGLNPDLLPLHAYFLSLTQAVHHSHSLSSFNVNRLLVRLFYFVFFTTIQCSRVSWPEILFPEMIVIIVGGAKSCATCVFISAVCWLLSGLRTYVHFYIEKSECDPQQKAGGLFHSGIWSQMTIKMEI